MRLPLSYYIRWAKMIKTLKKLFKVGMYQPLCCKINSEECSICGFKPGCEDHITKRSKFSLQRMYWHERIKYGGKFACRNCRFNLPVVRQIRMLKNFTCPLSPLIKTVSAGAVSESIKLDKIIFKKEDVVLPPGHSPIFELDFLTDYEVTRFTQP